MFDFSSCPDVYQYRTIKILQDARTNLINIRSKSEVVEFYENSVSSDVPLNACQLISPDDSCRMILFFKFEETANPAEDPAKHILEVIDRIMSLFSDLKVEFTLQSSEAEVISKRIIHAFVIVRLSDEHGQEYVFPTPLQLLHWLEQNLCFSRFSNLDKTKYKNRLRIPLNRCFDFLDTKGSYVEFKIPNSTNNASDALDFFACGHYLSENFSYISDELIETPQFFQDESSETELLNSDLFKPRVVIKILKDVIQTFCFSNNIFLREILSIRDYDEAIDQIYEVAFRGRCPYHSTQNTEDIMNLILGKDDVKFTCLETSCLKTYSKPTHDLISHTAFQVLFLDPQAKFKLEALGQVNSIDAGVTEDVLEFNGKEFLASTTKSISPIYKDFFPGSHIIHPDRHVLRTSTKKSIIPQITNSIYNQTFVSDNRRFVYNYTTINQMQIPNSDNQRENTEISTEAVSSPPFNNARATLFKILEFLKLDQFKDFDSGLINPLTTWVSHPRCYYFGSLLLSFIGPRHVKYSMGHWYFFLETGWRSLEDPSILHGYIAEHIHRFFRYMEDMLRKNERDVSAELKALEYYEQSYTDTSKLTTVINSLRNMCADFKFRDKLDTNWDLLLFYDCVYDLGRREKREGLPSDELSTYHHYELKYTKVKAVLKFFASIFPDKREMWYFLDVCASMLNKKIRNDRIYFLVGDGSNGKSLVSQLLTSTFAQFKKDLPSVFFCNDQVNPEGPQPILKSLARVKVAVCSEPSDSKFKASLIKKYCGQENITAREPHSKKAVDFKLFTKFMIMSNKFPVITEIDYAIERRIIMIHFDVKFVEEPSAPNEKKLIPELDHVCSSDTEFISSFMAILLLRHSTLGSHHLFVPPRFRAAGLIELGKQQTLIEWCKRWLYHKPGSILAPQDALHAFHDEQCLGPLNVNLPSYAANKGIITNFLEEKSRSLKLTTHEAMYFGKHKIPGTKNQAKSGFKNTAMREEAIYVSANKDSVPNNKKIDTRPLPSAEQVIRDIRSLLSNKNVVKMSENAPYAFYDSETETIYGDSTSEETSLGSENKGEDLRCMAEGEHSDFISGYKKSFKKFNPLIQFKIKDPKVQNIVSFRKDEQDENVDLNIKDKTIQRQENEGSDQNDPIEVKNKKYKSSG